MLLKFFTILFRVLVITPLFAVGYGAILLTNIVMVLPAFLLSYCIGWLFVPVAYYFNSTATNACQLHVAKAPHAMFGKDVDTVRHLFELIILYPTCIYLLLVGEVD